MMLVNAPEHEEAETELRYSTAALQSLPNSAVIIIIKRLIELHGGSIWFESVVGKGSTFSFTLPLLAAE